MDSRSRLDVEESASVSEQIAFVRHNGKYYPAKQTKLKNSLLAIVGCLEFANAMDFAANVWNTIPVPIFAAVLMGIGGSLALVIALFAFQDAALSRRNVDLLHTERRYLKKLKVEVNEEMRNLSDIDVHLDVTFREAGTEVIDRIGMDTVMGFAAILVGTGTLMAIGGANPKVYKVSNLFSGYIGNGLSAFYGLVNTGWSIFIWRRAHHHAVAGEKHLSAQDIKDLQKQRNNTIKLHAGLNGVTGLVAGIAGIITTTRWWGYVVLIPCIISAIYCNSVWRRKIGYERPSILHGLGGDVQQTIEEIRFAVLAQGLIRETPSIAFESLVSDKKSISSVTEFIIMNGFFEDVCCRLLRNSGLSAAILGPLQSKLIIDSRDILATREPHAQALLNFAETSMRETGISTFRDRQRFLLDKLGCQLCVTKPAMVDVEMTEKHAPCSKPNESSTNTDIFVTPASRAEPNETSLKEAVRTVSKEDPGSSYASPDISYKEAKIGSDQVKNRPCIKEAEDPPCIEEVEEPPCIEAVAGPLDTTLAQSSDPS